MGFEQHHTSPQESGDVPVEQPLQYTRSIPTAEEKEIVNQNKQKVSEFASKVDPLIKQIEEKANGDMIGLGFEDKGIDISYYQGQELEVTVREEDGSEWTLTVEPSTDIAYIEKHGGINVSTSRTDEASVMELEQTLSDVLQILEGMAAA